MKPLQRLILFFIPKQHRAAAEAESRDWQLVCSACGHARSVWDLGGVRWKASGTSVTRTKCPGCRRVGFHALTRRAQS